MARIMTLSRAYSCYRKVRYNDERAAQHAVLVMENKVKSPFVKYSCFVCGGWHVANDRSQRAQAVS